MLIKYISKKSLEYRVTIQTKKSSSGCLIMWSSNIYIGVELLVLDAYSLEER